jgi:hypothetical protein
VPTRSTRFNIAFSFEQKKNLKYLFCALVLFFCLVSLRLMISVRHFEKKDWCAQVYGEREATSAKPPEKETKAK